MTRSWAPWESASVLLSNRWRRPCMALSLTFEHHRRVFGGGNNDGGMRYSCRQWRLGSNRQSCTQPFNCYALALQGRNPMCPRRFIAVVGLCFRLCRSGFISFRRRIEDRLVAWALLTMLACVFFFGLLAAPADPFGTLLVAPLDGERVESVAQKSLMAIHPVMLYLGYVGFTVPLGCRCSLGHWS